MEGTIRFGSAITIVGLVAASAWYGVQAVQRERSARSSVACQANVLRLARAIRLYADEEGAFPEAGRWCDAILPYLEDRSTFTSPSGRNRACSYAFNAALAGARSADVGNASALVAVFESDAGWNATGGRELLPALPRHDGGDHVGFADRSSGYQKRKYEGADREGWVKRSHRDVKPHEWLKDYFGATMPVEWVPRASRESGDPIAGPGR